MCDAKDLFSQVRQVQLNIEFATGLCEIEPNDLVSLNDIFQGNHERIPTIVNHHITRHPI